MNIMKYCPECYKELPPNSINCPYCGYRTGNGDEEVPPGILQTPRVDSYIPPEQTILGLLLLLIFFWGINITSAALPIFFEAASKRNLLIAVIASQLATRALIGIWAVEEVSLSNKSTATNKLGAFFLALIPIGDIYSSLHAAKTAIRKERLTLLSTASLSAVIIMSLVLFKTSDQITNLISSRDLNALAIVTDPLTETEIAETEVAGTEVAAQETSTPEPTPTTRKYINGCRNPLSIKIAEAGDYIEVCGKITNFGVKECKDCPLGFYSFVRLEGDFQIVSYDWRFTYVWLRKCVRVEDKVELLGGVPAFVMSRSEGCTNDECETDVSGGLMDDGGYYFQPFDGCD
jgi:hypothetical protein